MCYNKDMKNERLYVWKKGLRLLLLAGALGLALLCAGCGLQSVDSLLTLPKMPAEYALLQQQLDEVLAGGAVYASAESGTSRQAVQQVDLDGDGQDETVAFFLTTEGAYQAHVFRQQNGTYTRVGVAEGFGSTLRAIYYPVCGSGGVKGLAMCWGFDENGAYGMTIYTMEPDGMRIVLDMQYADVAIQDVNGDGMEDVAFAIKDSATGYFSVRTYLCREKEYFQLFESPLCVEVKSVSSMQFGTIGGQEVALYIDSAATLGGYVTDVVCYDGHTALNCTVDPSSGSGSSTWRTSPVYCTDIDGDGVLDVPVGHFYERESSETETRCRLDWINIQPPGERSFVCSTFHQAAEKWYLTWPEDWDDQIYAERTQNAYMTRTTFYDAGMRGERTPILAIWYFGGDNRETAAKIYRTMKPLTTTVSGIYGYSVPEAGEPGERPDRLMDEETIRRLFHTIEISWNSEDY